jgi:uncharacterized membrane protein YesL
VGDVATTRRDFGEGTLSRAAAFVYWHLVVGVLLCAASLPSVVLLLLLERSAGNAALAPLCLIPYGPALSAALYALRDRTRAEALTPARAYLRGYRLNARDAVRAWAPAMVVLAVIVASLVTSLVNTDAAGVPSGSAAVLLVIATLVTLWALEALTIASFFAFRTRDVARLGAYYLLRRPKVTVGLVALVIVAVGVVWWTTEAVLWLFAVVWAAFWYRIAQPLLDDVASHFTTPTD